MPLKDIEIINENSKIITWDVSDDINKLLQEAELTPVRQKKYNSLTEKRKKEYLGLRLCLKHLGIDQDVLYEENGKPFLESDHHISITHSYDTVSVGVSKSKIGIDIELARPEKIENIRKKFIRADEETWLTNKSNYIDYLHIIWGIKEGLYKLHGGSLWNFLHHYKVNNFSLEENYITCCLYDDYNSKNYLAGYKYILNYYLTWVIDDMP